MPPFSCIADRKCSDAERIALVYDYVGAVYGGVSVARYDGTLTREEEQAVRSSFGTLTQSDVKDNFFGYLSKARSLFLNRVASPRNDPKQCEEDGNYRTYFKHPVLGEALVLSGNHWCGEQYGKKYAEFELEIAAHPEDWVFFYEGASAGADFIPSTEESRLIREIAITLNIPVYEAVMRPEDPRLLAEIKRRFGTTPLDMAVTLCFMQLFLIDKIQEQEKSTFGPTLEATIKVYAKAFQLDPRAVGKEFVKFVQISPGESVQTHFDRRTFDVVRVVKDHYVTVSNELTPPLVEDRLRRSGKKKALFLFGDDHLPIAQTIYGAAGNPIRAQNINTCVSEAKIPSPTAQYVTEACFNMGAQNISTCVEAVSKRIVGEVERVCKETARPDVFIIQCSEALLSTPWPNRFVLEEEVLPKMGLRMPKVLAALTTTHMMRSPDGRNHRGLKTLIEDSAKYYREGILANGNCMIDGF